MLRSKVRFATVVLIIAIGTILSTSASRSQHVEQLTVDSKVRTLQTERLAVLKAIAAELEDLYKSSRVPLDNLLQARRQVLQAELELCKTDKERVEILTKLVAWAKEREAVMEDHFKKGVGSHVDALKAKANRLQAEIALARVKS